MKNTGTDISLCLSPIHVRAPWFVFLREHRLSRVFSADPVRTITRRALRWDQLMFRVPATPRGQWCGSRVRCVAEWAQFPLWLSMACEWHQKPLVTPAGELRTTGPWARGRLVSLLLRGPPSCTHRKCWLVKITATLIASKSLVPRKRPDEKQFMPSGRGFHHGLKPFARRPQAPAASRPTKEIGRLCAFSVAFKPAPGGF